MAKPIKVLDLHHQIDRLRNLRLTTDEAAKIYTALRDYVVEYEEINQLLCVMPENQSGLFPIAVGLFHPLQRVRFAVVELLERISTHMVRHPWFDFLKPEKSLIKSVRLDDIFSTRSINSRNWPSFVSNRRK